MTLQINSAEAALAILEEYVAQAPGFDKDLLAACAYLRRVTWTPIDADKRMAEIEERMNAATPGDWYAYEWNETKKVYWIATSNPAVFAAGEDKGYIIAGVKNAKFIAHSRSDIPFLFCYVKALKSTLSRLLQSLDKAGLNESINEARLLINPEKDKES